MTNAPTELAALSIRILFAVLFTGTYAWLLLNLSRPLRLIPPPQRVTLFRAVMSRVMKATWFYIVSMTIAGVFFLYTSGFQISLIYLRTQQAIVLSLELIATILIIIVSSAVQLVFMPRLESVGIQIIKAEDENLQWLTSRQIKLGTSAMHALSWLATTNLLLGIITIALGVVYTKG